MRARACGYSLRTLFGPHALLTCSATKRLSRNKAEAWIKVPKGRKAKGLSARNLTLQQQPFALYLYASLSYDNTRWRAHCATKTTQ
jgi:hypothetical protein